MMWKTRKRIEELKMITNTLLLLGWIVTLVVSYKGAVALLKSADMLSDKK